MFPMGEISGWGKWKGLDGEKYQTRLGTLTSDRKGVDWFGVGGENSEQEEAKDALEACRVTTPVDS